MAKPTFFWPNHPSTRGRGAGDPFDPPPEKWCPKSWRPGWCAPKGGGPKISRFFPSPASIVILFFSLRVSSRVFFLSLEVFTWNVGGVLVGRDLKCACFCPGLSCETPPACKLPHELMLPMSRTTQPSHQHCWTLWQRICQRPIKHQSSRRWSHWWSDSS